MKRAVKQKSMPPWYADPAIGHFANDRSLNAERHQHHPRLGECRRAAKAIPKDMPAPANFVEGWGIPKPDAIFQLPQPFPVPAPAWSSINTSSFRPASPKTNGCRPPKRAPPTAP